MGKSNLPIIATGAIVVIIAVFILMSAVSNMEAKKTACIDKGFDFASTGPDQKWTCIKEMHYDPFTGKQIYCYMPIDKETHATEWCRPND